MYRGRIYRINIGGIDMNYRSKEELMKFYNDYCEILSDVKDYDVGIEYMKKIIHILKNRMSVYYIGDLTREVMEREFEEVKDNVEFTKRLYGYVGRKYPKYSYITKESVV